MPCSAIFKSFPTDRGMCCTFNLDRAEEIFRKSEYRDLISQMQATDSQLASSKNSQPPNSFLEAGEPIPQAGISKGLSLMLDAHTHLLSLGSVSEDFQGFFAFVGSTDAYPLTGEKNIRIRPGYDNLVSLSATAVTTDPDLQDVVSPDRRNCYFKDEYILETHLEYSQESCILECQVEFAKNNMAADGHEDCIPWYLPSLLVLSF